MLTVPTLIRAAANGLGGFLGETYEERAARERARIAHETAMRNAAANATASSPSGPRAPLPPGTVKTPWQAAADAAGNIFGSGVTTPPGTTAEADAADDTITSATPPINSSGAPSWGLFVGLGILVIGGGALAWSLWGRKSAAPAANRRRRRRNAGRSGVFSKKHEWTIDTSHEDIRLHGKDVSVYRYGQLLTTFRPTESQLRKIRAKRGKIHVTENQIMTARLLGSSYGR